jgi:hypothetical protein
MVITPLDQNVIFGMQFIVCYSDMRISNCRMIGIVMIPIK